MSDRIRVDHRTTERIGEHIVATTPAGGICPEHGDVIEPDEPVLLLHRAVVRDDEGEPVRVDLSTAEWGCQRGPA